MLLGGQMGSWMREDTAFPVSVGRGINASLVPCRTDVGRRTCCVQGDLGGRPGLVDSRKVLVGVHKVLGRPWGLGSVGSRGCRESLTKQRVGRVRPLEVRFARRRPVSWGVGPTPRQGLAGAMAPSARALGSGLHGLTETWHALGQVACWWPHLICPRGRSAPESGQWSGAESAFSPGLVRLAEAVVPLGTDHARVRRLGGQAALATRGRQGPWSSLDLARQLVVLGLRAPR